MSPCTLELEPLRKNAKRGLFFSHVKAIVDEDFGSSAEKEGASQRSRASRVEEEQTGGMWEMMSDEAVLRW